MTTILLLALVAAAVILLPLAIAHGRRDPWGPEADDPCGYQLTDRGHHAADYPTEYVLDEDNETWGPA